MKEIEETTKERSLNPKKFVISISFHIGFRVYLEAATQNVGLVIRDNYLMICAQARSI